MADSENTQSTETYKVILVGIRPDVPVTDARLKLSTLFKTTPEQVDKLLGTSSYVLKKGLTQEIAGKYKVAIESAGGRCRVEVEVVTAQQIDVDLPPIHEDDPSTSEEPSASSALPLREQDVSSEQKNSDITTLLNRLNGLTARDIKELFFLNYSTMMYYIAADNEIKKFPFNNTFGDLQAFSDDIGDLAFWGRALFYANDPEVERRLAKGESQSLVSESGRISTKAIQDLFQTINDGESYVDVKEIIRLMQLMQERFSMKNNQNFTETLRGFSVWNDVSEDLKKAAFFTPLRKLAEIDPASQLVNAFDPSGEIIKRGSGAYDTTDVTYDSAPITSWLQPILILAAGAFIVWLTWKFFNIPWISIGFGLVTIAVAIAIGCYHEHQAGRITIFWTFKDAAAVIAGPLFMFLIWFAGLFFNQQLNFKFFSIFVLVMLFLMLRYSFDLSARTNGSTRAFLLSIVAKMSVAFLAIVAALAYLARAVSTPQRLERETSDEYKRRLERHDASVTAQGIATTVGAAGVGWLFTRNATFDDIELPKNASVLRMAIINGLPAIIVLFMAWTLSSGLNLHLFDWGNSRATPVAEVPAQTQDPMQREIAQPPGSSAMMKKYRALHDVKSSAEWSDEDMVAAVEILAHPETDADLRALEEEERSTQGETCATGSCAIIQSELVAARKLRNGQARTAREALGLDIKPIALPDNAAPPLASLPSPVIAEGVPAHLLQGASFDCHKAKSTTEVLICSDAELSRMDSELAAIYRQAKADAPDAQAFKQRSIDAWKWREANCHDHACLVRWYTDRKVALLKGDRP